MKYRAEIDGLRALAILPVILYHAGFKVFSGGYVGVDIFFVISGYLITSIILIELEGGTFSLMNFYERRARRILPALFVVMLACLPFAWFWLLPEAIKAFSESLVSVPIFSSNILFWRTSGYFDMATELKPLIHTWSLAVEEQYYVFFPLFLMLMWKLGRGWILGLLIIIFSISLTGSHWMSKTHPIFAFYMLPTRGWELLIGGFIGFYFTKNDIENNNLNSGQLGSLFGLLLITYSVFAYTVETPFPRAYALVPTVGAALIIIFATNKTVVGKLLGSKLLVIIGLISYSAYLWHQPMFAFARERSLEEPSMYLMTTLAVLSFGFAFLSWKYVERPFRNKHLISRNTVFICGVLVSVIFIGIGVAGYLSGGFEGKHVNSLAIKPKEIDLPRADNGWCFYSIDTIKDLKLGSDGFDCFIGEKFAKKRGVLFGDSFAGQYEPFWDIIGKKEHLVINAITTNWCYPTTTNEYTGPLSSRAFEQCLLDRNYLVRNIRDYDFIVLGGRWGEVYEKHKMAGVLDLITMASAMNKLIVLMPSPKQFDTDIWRHYQKSIIFNATVNFKSVKSSDRKDGNALIANKILKDFSHKHSNVIYIDRESIFNNGGVPADLTKDGMPFTLEGTHISIYGSKNAAASFIDSNQYQALSEALNMIKH